LSSQIGKQGDFVRYVYFDVKNFKGIEHLRFELGSKDQGRIYTLVGLNESGKTTILEAIDFFMGASEDLSPSELAGRIRPNENELIPISKRANFNDKISIVAKVELNDDDKECVKRHLKDNFGFKLSDCPSEFEITDQYTYKDSVFQSKASLWPVVLGHGRTKGGRIDREINSKENRDIWDGVVKALRKRQPVVWYFPDFLFEFPERIYLTAKEDESSRNRFYRALLQDVLDSLGVGNVTVENHLLARALSSKSADRVALDNIVLKMARKMSEDIFTSWSEMLNRQVNMKVKLSVRVPTAPDDLEGPYLELQIEDSDGFYYISERSLGFRWFFAFYLLTSFRGARKDSARDLLFLFDEPASNLHSSAQQQLLKNMEKLATNRQVIYTTHSHHLINPDWLEKTFVVRNKATDSFDDLTTTAKETDIAIEKYRIFASSHPSQTQYFQPILDVLEYSPSKLELVPDIVLVEGKNDFYALRYAQLLLGGNRVNTYPGNGASTLDAVIALYAAWARNFIVLLDSDNAGIAQKARYEEKFGSLVSNRIFTLADIEPALAGAAMESVFSPQDRIAFASALGISVNASDKKSFNRMVQELLASKKPVPVDATTLAVMNAILTQLETWLAAVK
jgi:energy-coupling factor transporter ATP-binding protein EcfA2